MRFWDTSAIVPLLVDQEATASLRVLLDEDPAIAAWWGTPIECTSAFARLRREGVFTIDEEASAIQLLRDLREAWFEILPSRDLRDESMRLLRVHSLKAADALQLGSALTWTGTPREGELVTLDERLALAARLEGLEVVP